MLRLAVLALVSVPLVAQGHDHDDPHDHGHHPHHRDQHHGPHADAEAWTIADVLQLERNRDLTATSRARPGSSGTGALRFEVHVRSDVLPKEVFGPNPYDRRKRPILECAHGGFAYDHRPGRGEVYWFLQGAGAMRIERDRSNVVLLETADAMRALNMHNATFFVLGRDPRIAWPANGGGKVLVTDLDAKITHTIGRPTAKQYDKGGYSPTDTAFLDGKLWVTDGYGSKYVMAYDLEKDAWTDTIFGGRADKPQPGKFGTNHGITIHKGLLWVSGRYFARIHCYRPDTTFENMFPLPEGSKPCDFEFFVQDGKLYGVAASLDAAKDSDADGAAIYVVDMETLKVVSTIKPKQELGLDRFVHLHNVFPVIDDGRVTLFCQAWNPGDFAVLRQIKAADDDK